MPDAEVTSQVFRNLLADGARAGLWATLADLDAAAGLPPRTAAPGLHAAREKLF